MNKVIITETQFRKLIEYNLTEKSNNDLLGEGYKEILLGVAMLLGVNMNAQNTSAGNDALSSDEVITQIHNTINDDSTRTKLVNTMQSIGVEDAENRLLSANKDLLDKIGKNTKLGDVQSLRGTKSQIDAKLNSGNYAMVDIKSDTSFVSEIKTIKINLEIKFTSDNAFKTGSFELSDDINNRLLELKDSLSYYNPDDVSVIITSSTDTEPIRKFISVDDLTGNKKLATLRGNSVSDIISSFGVTDIKVKTMEDQGPEIYSTDMADDKRDSARVKTSEYRYVTVTVEVVNNVSIGNKSAMKDIKYTCEFVQIFKKGGKVLKKKDGIFSKIKISFFNKDGNQESDGLVCPMFK